MPQISLETSHWPYTLPKGQKAALLDMHNNPAWAMEQFQRLAAQGALICTVESSFNSFLQDLNPTQLTTWNETPGVLHVLPDLIH